MRGRHGARVPVFRWPALVAVISVVALVAGLLGDGVYDVFCLLGLALPVMLAGWFWRTRSG